MAGNTSDQALILAYNQVLGRDPAAAELALGEQQLQGGTPISAIRAYLATTGYATNLIGAIYDGVVAHAVSAPELASDQAYLAGGGDLASLRGYLAASNEAAGKLQWLYTDVVGRAITPGELGSDVAQISAGATLAGLRTYFATTSEATGKLQSLYETELGRAVTPGELASDEQLIANGSSLAAIRGYLSVSGEAVNAIERQYQADFPSAPAAADLVSGQLLLASGASLPFAAADAVSSTAFREEFQSAFGNPASLADILAGTRALADGASLPVAVASSPTVVAFINNTYSSLLGIAPSSGDFNAVEQQIASQFGSQPPYIPVSRSPDDSGLVYSDFTNPDVDNQSYAYPGLPGNLVTATAAASSAFANDINTAFQAAIGRPANAVELAADRSELQLGHDASGQQGTVTIATLQTQIAELSGGAPPREAGQYDNVSITPQTIAGVPGQVYGLLHNDALIALQPAIIAASLSGTQATYIQGFNPATDILQIESRQAAGYAALNVHELGVGSAGFNPASNAFTEVDVGRGATIIVESVSNAVPTAANFRFV